MKTVHQQAKSSPPTMVRTIDRMVRDGLVTREPDPADERASRIVLTDRGAALRDELVPRAIAVNEATLGRLSGQERTTFFELLRRLADPGRAAFSPGRIPDR